MKKTVVLFLSLVLLLGCLAGCKGGSKQAKSGELALTGEELACNQPTADNYRVFYEIFVGSFSDSDGDGVGDLRGIINRMDYLNDGDDNSGKSLGVEGLWLTPIFASNSYHKYDINDYYSVDPAFGTMEDLKELVELCHARNVKVILDLPINHTARMNQWYGNFVSAHRQGRTDDPYFDFYSYYTSGEPAPAGRSYAAVSGTDIYVECNFDQGMPEPNFDSDFVRQTMLDVAKYYLDLGIDGFRFDAAKYIYFGDNEKCVEFWKWYIGELRRINPEIYTVAEVWDGDGITDLYYPALNCFNFTTSQTSGLIAQTAQGGDVNRFTAYLNHYISRITSLNPDAMYLPFIANHDTDRCAGYLPSFNGRAQMAANLYLLCPGSPFLYYGEELGMAGSRGSAQTDANRRLAMVWGDDDTIKDPTGTTYPASSRANAPANEQAADPDSLYTYYKKVIMIRKANPEIARGAYSALSLPGTKVGGFTAAWNGSTVCVLHNTTTDEQRLDLKALGLDRFTVLNAAVGMNDAKLDGTTLILGAQTSAVLR